MTDPDLGAATGGNGLPPPSSVAGRSETPVGRRVVSGSRILPLVAAVAALVFFLAGYLLHSSGHTPRLEYQTVFKSGINMQSTVTESGTRATLRETFTALDPKKGAYGTVSPCAPTGSSLEAYNNLTIAIPDGCVLALKGTTSATITVSGPISVLLGAIGPDNFAPVTTAPKPGG